MAAAIWRAAQPGLVAPAALARSARRGPGKHDEVADVETADVLAELLDPRGALVAHHDACWPLPLAIHDVEVGVTDARGRHPDPDLAALRRVERQFLDPWLRPGPRKTTPRVLIGCPSTRPMLAPECLEKLDGWVPHGAVRSSSTSPLAEPQMKRPATTPSDHGPYGWMMVLLSG